MPARDTYHDAVVKALTAEGWTITDDPLPLTYGDQDLYIDLGAERGAITEPERTLFLAVPNRTYEGFLSRQFGQFILQDQQVPLIVFDPKSERILKWIS